MAQITLISSPGYIPREAILAHIFLSPVILHIFFLPHLEFSESGEILPSTFSLQKKFFRTELLFQPFPAQFFLFMSFSVVLFKQLGTPNNTASQSKNKGDEK
ncbi:hypothetical protein [Desulfopila inferna]|uniref:hypothetical protein n=1 Tax=Desulfopila inferna TaxID=468528 RepID=UPI001F0550EA|nr:hypothetical protein [Desulfopila inferna]